MEEEKVFDAYFALPDGYEAQLMVLRGHPGGRAGRSKKQTVFRSRVWIGHELEPDPLLHRSQEHVDLTVAIDACYSMLLNGSRVAISSPAALAGLEERVDQYFSGTPQAG